MKIKNATINIYIDDSYDHNEVRFDIKDEDSGITFVKWSMTHVNFCKALGKLAVVECKELEVFELDKLGKKQEHKKFEFELLGYTGFGDRIQVAKELVTKVCPKGWIPDLYFNRQSSFFAKDDEQWARCIIRRWIDDTNN